MELSPFFLLLSLSLLTLLIMIVSILLDRMIIQPVLNFFLRKRVGFYGINGISE